MRGRSIQPTLARRVLMQGGMEKQEMPIKKFPLILFAFVVLILGSKALRRAEPPPPPPPLFSLTADDGRGNGVKIRVSHDGRVKIHTAKGHKSDKRLAMNSAFEEDGDFEDDSDDE